MDCKRIRDLLADRALGKALPAEMEAHIAKCRDCSVELERVRITLSILDRELAAELAIHPSPEFTARVRRRLSEAGPSARPVLRWAAAAATVAIAVTITIVVARRMPPPEVPQVQSSRVQETVPTTSALESPEPASPVVLIPVVERPSSTPPPSMVARAPEPAVLVPPGQEAAILRFHRGVTQGRIFMSSAGRSRVAVLEDLAEPPGLGISALEVEPLRVGRIEIVPLAERFQPLDLEGRR